MDPDLRGDDGEIDDHRWEWLIKYFRALRLSVVNAHIPSMSVAAKICGLSSEVAVAAAVEGGAAYLGFVFYPPSPRAVSPARVAALVAAVPFGAQRVGLFVDAEDEAIRAVLDLAPIDILQFHGQESPDRVADVKARFQ